MKVKLIKIDFENIHERLVQVTNFPGDEGNLVISKDGETFYYTGNSSTAKGAIFTASNGMEKILKKLLKEDRIPAPLQLTAKENIYTIPKLEVRSTDKT